MRKKRSLHYDRWANMMARCYRPTHPMYKHYGGREIGVCKAWRVYREFEAWVLSTYSEGLWLERINNNLGYSPENCAWATRQEQMQNRRKGTPAQLAWSKRMHQKIREKRGLV